MDVAHLVHAQLVSARRRFAGWLRAPAFHFAAIGAGLFALSSALRPTPVATPVERAPIVVSGAQVEQLVESYERSTGLRASPLDARALVERQIDEEVLFREARAHGLDREDRGVQWRLIEKMTFLSDHESPSGDNLLGEAIGLGLDQEDPIVRRIVVEKMRLALAHAGSQQQPTDAELGAYLEAHRDHFLQPARVRLSHLLLARDRHPETLAPDAGALLATLRRDGVLPEQATLRGDPFPLPTLSWSISEREIRDRFGDAFGRVVAKLEPGAWSDPVPSPFGLHLVWVHERVPERLPALAEVRGPVLYGLLAERRAKALVEGVRKLRAEYTVQVEWPSHLATTAASGSS